MLLLFGTSSVGVIGAAALTLTLSAPPITLAPGAVVIAVTACELSLSAPSLGGVQQVIGVTPAVLTLAAPPAAPVVSGSATIPVTAATLHLSSGGVGVSLDLTTRIITIAGVARAPFIRPASLTITDALDEAPNTCGFICHGFVPVAGQEVIIALGSVTNILFAGHLTTVNQIYEERRVNVAYQCSAVDYTRLLDRRSVHKTYATASASSIVQDIIATSTSGFTVHNVASGLPTVAAMEFTWEAPTRALTRLAKLIGAYWYVDYERDIHFFLEETSDAPDAITEASHAVQTLARASDISQVRTRMVVEGGGSKARSDVAPGASAVPIDDPTWYSSGLVKTGAQRIAYAGVTIGGGVSILRGIDGPSAAPSAALAATAGGVLGLVNYRVSFKNSAGETVPGPTSNSVTGLAFPLPAAVGGLSALAGGRVVGTVFYAMTHVTTRGETMRGASSGIVAAAHPIPIGGGVLGGGFGPLVGTFAYKVTNVTAEGETLPSAAFSRGASATPSPSFNSGNLAQNALVGNIAPGSRTYAITWVTTLGETLRSGTGAITVAVPTTAPAPSASSVSAAGDGDVPVGTYQWTVTYLDENGGESFGALSGFTNVVTGPRSVTLTIPVGPAGVRGRRIYRVISGATRFVGDVNDNLATSFTDNVRVPGAGFAGGTMGGRVNVTVPSPPVGVTVIRARIYRARLGTTAPLYLVADVPVSGGGIMVVDNTSDSAATVDAPTVHTAGGERNSVSVPIGPAGTLARRIYRSAAGGGGGYTLLAELGDNTTGTFIDGVPDGSASGGAPPLVSTAGGVNISVGIPAGPSGTLARKLYRTKAGGGEFFAVTQISGNVADTYVDTATDEELGEGAPLVNEAGASAVTVSGIPIGPAGITSRRVYRRDGVGVYRLVQEIKDNTTTSLVDDNTEKELGDVAPLVSTIGALEGDTVLLVDDAASFQSSGGWAYIGNQVIRYTATTASALTGIPASGAGSIQSALKVGDDVTAGSMLIGIPASGVGAILDPIKSGDAMNVLVERDDTAAQAILAALEGGDGVHEVFVQDERLSAASCVTRADAELGQFALAEQRLTFSSRDPKLRSGKTISVNLGAPTNMVGTFKVQQVVFSQFDVPRMLPLRTVTASNYLYSLEHLLRRVDLGA